MSSLTGSRRTYVAPDRGLGRATRALAVPVPGPGPALALGIALALALCAFIARGGTRLERTTWAEVGIMLTGAGLVAAALVLPRPAATPARLRGAWVVAAFALLAVFTALSISWSLAPGASWLEANRTLSYLAALAGGVALGRLFAGRWAAVVHGVALAAVVICGWALLTKVFPAALAPDEPFARLRPPFDYWNSVGLAAAMGIVPLLWLAARRSGHAAVNALAWPALSLLLVCLLLAYSRGALAAAGVGVAIWIALVPLRLRAAIVVGSVVAVTLPVVAWAFAQDGLTEDGPPMAARVDAGQELGALLLLVVVALLIAGLAVGFLGAQRPPSERARRRAGRVLVGALLAVPAVSIMLLANAPGGISGQVSKAWKQAVDPTAHTPPNTPARLTATASVRARYWREAVDIYGVSPLLGTGAGSYGTLRPRYRLDARTVQHAHGYVVQTLSDLGWVGLGLAVLATLAWLVAAARALGVTTRERAAPWSAERVGLATLAVVAIVFGLHSAIDWTWFVPGNAIPALLCAGWVASRGPLRERLEAARAPAPPRRRVALWPAPRAAATGALVMAIALLAAWSTLQPLRAAHAEDAAFARFDQGALPQAASIARIAHKRNPLAVEPLFDLAAIQQASGELSGSQRTLEQAIDLEPANAETWRRLGGFLYRARHDTQGALRAYQAAYYLDPHSPQSMTDVLVLERELHGG